MGNGRFMPPREIADYLYDLEEAVDDVWERHQPEGITADVKVKYYNEPYADLLEEGWEMK